MKRFIRRTIESIKQIIFWFPIIWNTRDFDYGDILEMLELKMKRTYDFLTSKDCMSEQKEEDLLALKRCIEIISILYNQEYETLAYEEHYNKYPIKPLEEWFIDDPKYPNCRVMKPMTEEERNSFGLAGKDSEKSHSSLVKEFGRLFGKHYRCWWD